jgi:hypothetical protein
MEIENKCMWMILVPTISNEGKPFKLRYHKVWDKKVQDISGGQTILAPAKGNWISPKGILFSERMIPVCIIATKTEINKIVDLTLKYYQQEAVLAFKISDEVIIKYSNLNKKEIK